MIEAKTVVRNSVQDYYARPLEIPAELELSSWVLQLPSTSRHKVKHFISNYSVRCLPLPIGLPSGSLDRLPAKNGSGMRLSRAWPNVAFDALSEVGHHDAICSGSLRLFAVARHSVGLLARSSKISVSLLLT
jgi:hypothetical protein